MLPSERFEDYMTGDQRTVQVEGYGTEQLVARIAGGPADFVAAMDLTKPELMTIYFARLARGG